MIFKWFAKRRQFKEDHDEAILSNLLPPCHYCGKPLFTENKVYAEYQLDKEIEYGCVDCWDGFRKISGLVNYEGEGGQ